MNSDPFAKTEENSVQRQLLQGASREDVVVEALQECQAAIDAGKSIDREAILAKYPMIRDELSDCLEGLALMQLSKESLGTTPSRDASPATGQLTPSATLGDFRIERELGRGGMGVVYEAEQLSVGRKVALKVLPYAAMLDKRQVTRFQNEARAAATLEHPNIVPVYFVGNERGVYYYAMRLIDGKNLAEVLEELRGNDTGDSPLSQISSQLLAERQKDRQAISDAQAAEAETVRDQLGDRSTSLASDQSTRGRVYFESIARLAKQAAEALDFAHSHGIIHRDIKPANIMLDDLGDAWITDFGLARIEADAGMTMTGDLVGTLRYMSPEQALAKRVSVDHRADIYSLGATLYELLTLQPIFQADDRATLLKRIAFEDPKSPSKIDSKVPYDLETIVQKAISKNPEDRYDSAGGMAADLKRFLQHEPVLARRTPLLRRARLWMRRHPTTVVATVVTTLAAFASLATAGFVVAAKEKDARIEISDALDQRNNALQESNGNLTFARENLQMALEAVHEMNALVASKWIASDRDLTDTQISFLEGSAETFQRIASQFGDDPQYRFTAGNAYLNSGDSFSRIGKLNDAEVAYTDAIRLLQQEVDAGASQQATEKLGIAFLDLGGLQIRTGKYASALENYDKAYQIYGQLRSIEPANISFALNSVAAKEPAVHIAMMRSQGEEAVRLAKGILDDLDAIEVADLDEKRRILLTKVHAIGQLVRAHQVAEEHKEAELVGTDFLNRAKILLANRNDDRTLTIQLASIRADVATSQMKQGKLAEAENNLREAMATTMGTFLYDGRPHEFMRDNFLGKVSVSMMQPMAFLQYSEMQTRLGEVLLRQGKFVEGALETREALHTLNYFDDVYPESIEYMGAASGAAEILGKVNFYLPDFDDGIEVVFRGLLSQEDLKKEQLHLLEDSFTRLQQRARQMPQVFLPNACTSGARYANLLNRAKSHEEAMQVADSIVSLVKELTAGRTDEPWVTSLRNRVSRFYHDLKGLNLQQPQDARTYARRGNQLSSEGETQKALSDFEQAIQMQPDLVLALNGAAWILATDADAKIRDGKKAVEYATRACEVTNWQDPDYFDTLAAAYAEAGQFENAVKWQTKAVAAVPEEQRDDFQSRLDLYQSDKPFREPPK